MKNIPVFFCIHLREWAKSGYFSNTDQGRRGRRAKIYRSRLGQEETMLFIQKGATMDGKTPRYPEPPWSSPPQSPPVHTAKTQHKDRDPVLDINNVGFILPFLYHILFGITLHETSTQVVTDAVHRSFGEFLAGQSDCNGGSGACFE